jgi:bis(5'-nucleosidyl)-tetraphosphatase
VACLKKEKSCGALVYRREGDRLMLLLLRHRHGGHWSFPKGHMEDKESEAQTALREILEETGLTVSLQEGFRHAVVYYPKPGIRKQVVYFLGQAADNQSAVRQEDEISELRWVDFKEAGRAVSFKNDRNLLALAENYFAEKGLL